MVKKKNIVIKNFYIDYKNAPHKREYLGHMDVDISDEQLIDEFLDKWFRLGQDLDVDKVSVLRDIEEEDDD